jgi:hypothetical protein
MKWFRERAIAHIKSRAVNIDGRRGALPLSDVHDGERTNRVLTTEEKASILAALHDAVCLDVAKIGPWPTVSPSAETHDQLPLPRKFWTMQVFHAGLLKHRHRPLIKAILSDVREKCRAEQGPPGKRPDTAGSKHLKRTGRKPLAEAKVRKRERLIADWKHFQSGKNGTKKDFCKDRRIALKELDRSLAWARTRRNRAEGPLA